MRSMKVTLINPPFLFPAKDEIIQSHCLGIRYLSAFLKNKGGHQVVLVDALKIGIRNVHPYTGGYIVGLELDEIVRQIPEDTNLIGVSVPFSQIAPIAHDLIAKIKERFPALPLVMGGVYPSTQPQLALTSQADCIVVGEGEGALLQLANGEEAGEIRGVYRRGTTSDSFPPAVAVADLDSIPFPDYDLPDIDDYFSISPRNVRKQRTASIVTSRGCPFQCEFCSIHPVYGRKWRGRSAQSVLEEIEYLNKRFGVTSLEIEDDNFTMQKQRTIDILEGIVRLNEQGAGLSWNTPNGVRIDTLDADIIKLIARSNCKTLVLALEHGDQEMLRIMNKELDLHKAFAVIRALIENKIKNILIFIIVGYPGETRERFENSLIYLKKIKTLGGNVKVYPNIAQPYPGTGLLKKCLDEGFIRDREIDNFLKKRSLLSTGYTVTITTSDFDEQEVLSRKERIRSIFPPKLLFRVYTRLKRLLPAGND